MTNPFGSGGQRLPRSTLREIGAWFLALFLALALWLSVNLGERESERTLRVRIDLVSLPAGMVITNAVPDYAQVRVRGSGLLLSSIDANRLATRLDLSGVRPGRVTYTLPSSDFSLPRNVEVSRVTPSRISLDIDSMGTREVPIRLATRGELREGLELNEAIILPTVAMLEGPQSRLATIDEVRTRRIDLAELDAGVNEVTGRLQRPGGKVRLRDAEVRVRLVIGRLLARREFSGMPVAIRNAQGNWRAVPESIAFVVEGPVPAIESLELPESAVTVDATDIVPPETASLSPEVALPPGFRLVEAAPQVVELVFEGEADDNFMGPVRPTPEAASAEELSS